MYQTIGFIGTGNMGSAIAKAAAKSGQAETILLSNRTPAKAAALAAAVLGGCFSVFLPLHQVELERTRILEAAAASGISEAVLPPYNHDGWLWDADNAPKMELFYGQTVPGGLTITFETQ